MTNERPLARPRNARGEGQRLAGEILDAAAAIVEETGGESLLSLRGIARRVGVSVPAIYLHFTGLEQIVQELVGRAWGALTADVGPALTAEAPAAERLHNFTTAYVSFGRNHPELYRLLFDRRQPSAVPEVGAEAARLFEQLVACFATATGRPAESSDLHASAVSLWLEIHGLVVLPPTQPRFPWPSDAVLIASALRKAQVSPTPQPRPDPALKTRGRHSSA